MYKEEYEMLEKIDETCTLVTSKDLINTLDRTLLYGYTCDRDTWHVYLQDNKIHTIVYNNREDEEPRELSVVDNEQYVPNKRLYPECCDYEFCRILKDKGVFLPFTTWSDGREKQIYYGKIL
jgi:hypothetical protein